MRTFGIWTFGLLASAIAGGLIGAKLDTGYSNDGGVFGMLAGMFAFACAKALARSANAATIIFCERGVGEKERRVVGIYQARS